MNCCAIEREDERDLIADHIDRLAARIASTYGQHVEVEVRQLENLALQIRLDHHHRTSIV